MWPVLLGDFPLWYSSWSTPLVLLSVLDIFSKTSRDTFITAATFLTTLKSDISVQCLYAHHTALSLCIRYDLKSEQNYSDSIFYLLASMTLGVVYCGQSFFFTFTKVENLFRGVTQSLSHYYKLKHLPDHMMSTMSKVIMSRWHPLMQHFCNVI